MSKYTLAYPETVNDEAKEAKYSTHHQVTGWPDYARDLRSHWMAGQPHSS